jgi:hypothetical protein
MSSKLKGVDTMTHYLLSVWGPGEQSEFGAYGSEEEMQAAMAATGAFNDRLADEGRLVFVNGLAPALSSTTVVDGQGDQPIFTDGPYLESKEYMNGLWIIEAADLDEALKLAAEASKVCRGKVEVRPVAGP